MSARRKAIATAERAGYVVVVALACLRACCTLVCIYKPSETIADGVEAGVVQI